MKTLKKLATYLKNFSRILSSVVGTTKPRAKRRAYYLTMDEDRIFTQKEVTDLLRVVMATRPLSQTAYEALDAEMKELFQERK